MADDKQLDAQVQDLTPITDEDPHGDPALADSGSIAGAALVEEAPRPWRPAKSLLKLKAQVNAAYPGRKTGSDGMVGDAAHQSRSSDHNPWITDGGSGVVSAYDITHDPAHGCDAGRIVEALRASRDRRIKYLIWSRRIANASPIGAAPAWAWRTYTGSNPHDHHCHISVKPEKALYDDEAAWALPARGAPEAPALAALAETDAEAEADIRNALDALPGTADKPLFEALVDAQDEVAALLTRYSVLQHAEAPAGAVEAQAEAPRLSFETLKPEYERLYASCTILPAHAGEVAWHIKMLRRNKERYREVEGRTSAPWWFVGIVHALEASFNFAAHLHNGDPLTARTVQVPRGRPPVWNPPSDWLSSAIDAIQFEGYAGQADWSLARTLFRLEGYNGYSYHKLGINSPYLWSFSNHYRKGKFVRDHVYDPNAVSKQCGAAVMMKALTAAGEAVVG